MGKRKTKPYDHRERLYVLWIGIKQRCNNRNNISYKYYGGKGIKVCKEWEKDYLTFKEWALKNGYDENLPRGEQTIDRVNPLGDYEPNNCRFITIQKQQRNKECVKKYEYNGEIHTLPDWAEILGIEYSLLHGRIFTYGWSIKDAIERPRNYRVNGNYVKVNLDGTEKTLLEISKETGISHTVLKKKYDNGYKIEDVIREYAEKGKYLAKRYEYDGKNLTISEWSTEIGVPTQTLQYRLRVGMPYEKVFTKKKQYYGNKKASE